MSIPFPFPPHFFSRSRRYLPSPLSPSHCFCISSPLNQEAAAVHPGGAQPPVKSLSTSEVARVCLSVHSHISETTRLNFSKFSVQASHLCLGLAILLHHCNVAHYSVDLGRVAPTILNSSSP